MSCVFDMLTTGFTIGPALHPSLGLADQRVVTAAAACGHSRVSAGIWITQLVTFGFHHRAITIFRHYHP